jgi:small conductance mechanosensitive channel
MDVVKQWVEQAVALFPSIIIFAENAFSGLAIFILGVFVGRWARKRIRNADLGGRHLDATLKPVLASAIFYAIIAMTLYAVLIKLGVPPTSLIAAFATAGLAIALSLKDTLSNIASGIMLLVLRPLAVGEYVCLGKDAGTVAEVGLFATTLKTIEGLYIYIPNSKVWDTRIENFGRHSIRRFNCEIGISYDSDLPRAQAVITEVLRAAPGYVPDAPTAAEVFVTVFAPHAITLSCRAWLQRDNWLEQTSTLRIQILTALKAEDIHVPTLSPAMMALKGK